MLKRLVISFFCSRSKPLFKDASRQSKYYIPKEPPERFLNKHNIVYRVSSSGIQIKECMFCLKPHNNDRTNLYTLNVHRQTGCFHCFRCSSSGSYFGLREKILGIDDHHVSSNQRVFGRTDQSTAQHQGDDEDNEGNYHAPQAPAISQAEYFALHQRLHTSKYSEVKNYLTSERGLTEEALNAYKVGAGQQLFVDQDGQRMEVKVAYFPMFQGMSDKQKKKFRQEVNDYIVKNQKLQAHLDDWRINTQFAKLVKFKARGTSADTEQHIRQHPTGSSSGFFGYNLVKEDTKQIVITEGQLDAMSVYQKTGKVALSLPQGASHIPDQLIPLLDRFERITLWMNNDKAGELNASKIAHKIGEKRTFLVENKDQNLKGANDVLRSNPSLMKELLEEATTMAAKNILTFEDIKKKLRSSIQNSELQQGIPSTVFPFYNKRVKGFRPGQLTILSGGTGSGKTTLLSQLSIDFCSQKVKTLWGSFQIKNDVLAYTMLAQYSKINLKKHKDVFEYHASKFADLPLYWLSFHGSTDLQKVFGTIEYAIQKYQVSHVVIDTLQFLLSDQAEGYKKFDLQDRTVGRLRSIATKMNVHVTVVIHPKKVDEGEDLGIHAIFGSSKSVQEADNVWMIQLRDKFKILEIKKNRFDGELGKVAIGFDKGTKSFFQLKRHQIEALAKGESMDDIVQQRLKASPGSEEEYSQMMSAINPQHQTYKQPRPRWYRPT